MKLSKKAEANVLQAYKTYFDSYVGGDTKAIAALLDDDYTQIGSAETEVFFDKKEAMKFLYNTIDQVAGKADIRNRVIKAEVLGDYILVIDLFDMYVLTDDEWAFYAKMRASTLMEKTTTGWKFVYQHSSMPDARALEGDNIAIEKISAENQQLREAVKRRTVELESKSRELAIEASLERVRAVAMGMHKQKDLLKVCKQVFKELKALGFAKTELRNAQIVINNDDKGMYYGYQHSAQQGSEFAEVPYNIHPTVKYLRNQLKKSDKAFADIAIKGKKLADWQDFVNSFPQKYDKELNAATELHYYFHSVGIGALGISSYQKLREEKVNLLRRFSNVFNLSYQRYQDITQAEAQAYEAQIELGLERVRARAMAMQTPNELAELVDTLTNELTKLDFALTACIINIIDGDDKSNSVWVTSPEAGNAPESYYLKFEDYEFHHGMWKAWKARKTKWVYTIEGDEKKMYDEYLFNETEFRRFSRKAQTAFRALDRYVASFTFSNFGGLQTIGDQPLSEDSLDILARFGNVFDLTYTRFNDLKQAEEQAREAQIELGLERVRARAMAMQSTVELAGLIVAVFHELQKLDMELTRGLLWIFNAEDKSATAWLTNVEDPNCADSYHVPYHNHPAYKSLLKGWHGRQEKWQYNLKGKVKDRWDKTLVDGCFKSLPNKVKKAMKAPEQVLLSGSFNKYGVIQTAGLQPLSDHNQDILQRFSQVFEQTYTRFLDLKQAEAQAREAQIEAGLERVRASTMAMQKTTDLLQVGEILYKEIGKLGVVNLTSGYVLMDEDEKIGWNYNSDPSDGTIMAEPVGIPHTVTPVMRAITKSWKNKEPYHLIELDPQETIAHQTFVAERSINFPHTAEELISFSPERLILQTFNFKEGYLILVGGEKINDSQVEMMIRFTKVFEQSYTRFLDLQKAEGQARESEIELALERVRARTMAMQHSDELKEVILEVLKKLQDLGISMKHRATAILTFEDGNKNYEQWVASPEYNSIISLLTPYFDHPIQNDIWNSRQNGTEFYAKSYTAEEKNSLFNYLFNLPALKDMPEEEKTRALQFKYYDISIAFKKNAAVLVVSHSGIPLNEVENTIIKRLAKVFDQTYTRFLDLQKAEEQAREAQIEAALERVRSKSMAMHKSEDIGETVATLFDELLKVGIHKSSRSGIGILNETKSMKLWSARSNSADEVDILTGNLDMTINSLLKKITTAWRKQEEQFYYELEGKELLDYYGSINQSKGYALRTDLNTLPEKEFIHVFTYKHGIIYSLNSVPISAEAKQVFIRFAKVFEQSYTRFLDLQKAEAQTRTAQINLAVERVRAKALAMHKSAEIIEVVACLKNEVMGLDIPDVIAATIFLKEGEDKVRMWDLTSLEITDDVYETPTDIIFKFKKTDPHLYYKRIWENQANYFVEIQDEKGLKRILAFIREHGKDEVAKELAEFIEETQLKRLYHATKKLNNGKLVIDLLNPPVDEMESILTKMGAAFDLAYKRFEDLQQAEAQAREAQIEVALEKVRSRSLAMHKSEELKEVIQVVYEQFIQLNINAEHAGFAVDYKLGEEWNYWVADPNITAKITVPHFDSVWSNQLDKALKKGDDFYATKLDFKQKNKFYRDLLKHVPSTTKKARDFYFSCPGLAASTVIQEDILLYIENFSATPYSDEENNILRRFGKVFQQSYTRFLDLQKAEEQAREAQIEAALERVRSKSMAMHKSEDMGETVATLFAELLKVGIHKSSRSGIGILNETKNMKLWSALSNSADEVDLLIGILDMTINPLLKKIKNAWKKQDEQFYYELEGKELSDYYASINQEEKYALRTDLNKLPEKEFIHVFTHKHGIIYSFNSVPISAEAKQVFIRFAKVFEQTYTRFLDLQRAEEQAREAQIETALERVRSRTMAMQKGEEIKDIVVLLYKELIDLGVTNFVTCGYVEINEEINRQYTWVTSPGGDSLGLFYLPLTGDATFDERYAAWKQQQIIFHQKVAGKVRSKHLEFAITTFNSKEAEQMVLSQFPDPCVFYCFNFSHGYLHLVTGSKLKHEEELLLARFTKVFEQTYARFLDLQKAEAQAREAQIEASLDRVRAASMAMHHSADLQSVITVVLEQFEKLEIQVHSTFISEQLEDTKAMHFWVAASGQNYLKQTHISKIKNKFFTEFYKAIKNGNSFYTTILTKAEKNQLFHHYFKNSSHHDVPLKRQDFVLSTSGMVSSTVLFDKTALTVQRYTRDAFLDKENEVIKRIGFVFEQAYTRFLDLQKAEAQAREAQIEAALERVRSRSMAMHKSEELLDVIGVISEQFMQLNLVFHNISFGTNNQKGDFKFWFTSPGQPKPLLVEVPFIDNPAPVRVLEAQKQGIKFFADVVNKKENKQWVEHLFKHSNLKHLPKKVKDFALNSPGYARSTFIMNSINLFVGNYEARAFTESENAIFSRFTQVFEQSYTRFLDLQKAEEQAREAQIEAGLERVRSRTLAMHSSAELAETAVVLFKQLMELGIEPNRLFIAIIQEDNGEMEFWITDEDGSKVSNKYSGSSRDNRTFQKMFKGWQQQKKSLTIDLQGTELQDYFKYLGTLNVPFKKGREQKRRVQNMAYFSQGFIGMAAPEPQPDATIELLERFAAVFNLTYTRFNDLQIAEAQARESKIEAALEKVRSRSIGMQQSDELKEVIQVIHDQLIHLDFEIEAAGFTLDYKQTNDWSIWFANKEQSLPTEVFIPYTDHPQFHYYIGAKEKGLDFLANTLSFKEKNSLFEYMFPFMGDYPQEEKDEILNAPGLAISQVFMKNVTLWVDNYEGVPFSDEENSILKRFAKVFEQTYVRFNDLKHAESQAREAKVEAALERIRSQAMAMNESSDLLDIVVTMRTEFVNLGHEAHYFWHMHWLPETYEKAMTSGDGTRIGMVMKLPRGFHENAAMSKWEKNKEPVAVFPYDAEGAIDYVDKMVRLGDFQKIDHNAPGPDDIRQIGGITFIMARTTHGEIGYSLPGVVTNPPADDLATLVRFARVFDLAYKRFEDLKSKERQTREARIELALERVRARALAMQEPEELKEVADVLREEMGALGIEALETCSIYINDEEANKTECWYAIKDIRKRKKRLVADHFALDLNDTWVGREMLKFYNVDKENTSIVMTGKKRLEWIRYCEEKSTAFQGYYGKDIPDRTYHLYKFSHGAIGAATAEDISTENWGLLKRAATVFSLAYSRFKDLSQAKSDLQKLKKAKTKAEKALAELESTQTQLIHSEKMASLGELTAGIAHEIQNPLNFVNNFSEVSGELVDEMKDERAKLKDERDEALEEEILDDLKQNLEKINHHGQRASGIVKGMLEHSRTGDGTKELTDINKLADEYLRLSYHGLRAKDKSFNADFKTDFDESLPEIKVLTQDLGRVILNLINNAFYASSTRALAEVGNNYKPTVTVTTRKIGNNIEITVKDNGSGIPDDIKEKIFEPFFTTKPTGSGTGLGLSMSYDIITKGHGGELKVESESGKGSEFIIQIPIKK